MIKRKTKLFKKKRAEFLQMNAMRISYSLDDVLIEDFIDQKEHPYSIYDLNGNLLETNTETNMFTLVFNKYADTLKAIIAKYGMG